MNVARLSSNRRPSVGGVLPDENTPVGKAPTQVPVKKQAVKRHHHKHNLKHRYEFLETLGKGTYGKVKKAKERSGRLVRRTGLLSPFLQCEPDVTLLLKMISVRSVFAPVFCRPPVV